MPDLLLELFSEEIPARMQRKAAGDLRKFVTDALVDSGLTYEGAKEFWTPRRLTLSVNGLTAKSQDVHEERKGPRVDAPEKAIEGFLRGAGLASIDEATVKNDPKKGDFYVAVINKPGRKAEDIIADAMPDIVRRFPWPKSMRWGEQSSKPGSLRWVRPLQSILCTFGPETEDPEVVSFDVDGIQSGDITHGHRFHAPDAFQVKRLDDYMSKLETAHVVLDPERRKDIILHDAKDLAFAQGLELVEDPGLLEEVSGLVEWPVVLLGEFDEAFLDIPPEVIQLTIKENQKCFVLKSQTTGKLTNKFILVANIAAKDNGIEIAKGNARVVRARLSDAKFFWETDLKTSLDALVEKLKIVTFHEKLGSQYERVERIRSLASDIAPLANADSGLVDRAALLAKADLMSEMVYEFTELQGLMGRYYAERMGEHGSVAIAMEDHYKPQGPSDDVPTDPVAITVALADKLDTLRGFWAIDEKPTSSKDPYALRRAALGAIRIILENNLRLNLSALGSDADLLSFFHDRLRVYLKDKGARHDLIDAVIAPDSDDLMIVVSRIDALDSFLKTEDGQNLLAGYKRAANILAAEEKKGAQISTDVSTDLLEKAEEIALHEAILKVEDEVRSTLKNEDFKAAMTAISHLRAPVDAFFDNILVNDENAAIRANRLALLTKIRDATGFVADFNRITA